MSSNLTIAIPTYNRNQKLLSNLEKLLIQITNEKILILDNHSDIPVQETLKKLVSKHPDIDIRIHRNKTNVGIANNFLRCFEYCDTKWMWLLSDDDSPYDDAVQIISKDISKHSEHVFFNYASSMVEKGVPFAMVERNVSFETSGANDFAERLDSFVNTIFVSAGVYNIDQILPNLRMGYIYGYSLAPHIAVVLASLGKEGKILFSVEKVVAFDPPSPKDTWSRLTYSQVINILLEVPVDLSDKAFMSLFNKINRWFLSDKEMFEQVKSTYKNSKIKRKYIFIQLIARTIFKGRTVKQKFQLFIMLLKLFVQKNDNVHVPDTVQSTLSRL